MNQNLEKDSVCQFYVVFGGGDLKYPVDDNVYIEADQFRSIDELKKAVLNEFQKNSKKYRKISSEIIFWIPAENYRKSAEHIMSLMGFNGKIQVTPLQKIEQKLENVSDEVSKSNYNVVDREDKTKGEQEEKIVSSESWANSSVQTISSVSGNVVNSITNIGNQGKEEKQETSYSYHPTPVYHGDSETPLSRDSEKAFENTSNQSAFSNGYGSMRYDEVRGEFNQQRGKTLVRKKPNAFVSLPVIIFVLSALLLISSAILLFVID